MSTWQLCKPRATLSRLCVGQAVAADSGAGRAGGRGGRDRGSAQRGYAQVGREGHTEVARGIRAVRGLRDQPSAL